MSRAMVGILALWLGVGLPCDGANAITLDAADRVLVIAPHPDDESLGAGGLIRRAVSSGASVRVVFVTSGDHNELAFLLYRRRPAVTPTAHIQMGDVRMSEAIRAAAELGLAARDLVFLGFPDGGTLDMWQRHWGNASPYMSPATHARSVPYGRCPTYGRPYSGDALLTALVAEITRFRPTKVITSAARDRHPDHRAAYLFTVAALFESALATPTFLTYMIHTPAWPTPAVFAPTLPASPPGAVPTDGGGWITLDLVPDDIQGKERAVREYRSQLALRPRFLLSFVRRTEVFLTAEPVQFRAAPLQHALGIEVAPDDAALPDSLRHLSPIREIGSVSLRDGGDALTVTATLRGHRLRPNPTLHIDAHGYGRDGARARIRIDWSSKQTRVREGARTFARSGISVTRTGRDVTARIPWRALRDPALLFLHVSGSLERSGNAQTTWVVVDRSGGGAP